MWPRLGMRGCGGFVPVVFWEWAGCACLMLLGDVVGWVGLLRRVERDLLRLLSTVTVW
jgi:hypothetical protein